MAAPRDRVLHVLWLPLLEVLGNEHLRARV
jgi:hypothetical protein